MKTRSVGAVLASLGLAALALGACERPAPSKPAASAAQGSLPRFADFGLLPPPGVFQPERVFKLSQDYPAGLPPMEPAVSHLLTIDFTKDWKAYMQAGLDYILAGNIENRALQDTFFLEDNKVRRWYHVPWQQWGDNGREGLHGLTAEGPVYPHVLAPAQKDTWQTYAVEFYNDRGGHEIGRVWGDATNPSLDAIKADGGFPAGTVVAKLLFTTAPVAQVPFLSNPIEWTAYVRPAYVNPTPNGLPINPRIVATVRLIQVDIMVRDPRADATGGWVYGTWVYNGLQSPPFTPGQKFDNRWKNLVPVGMMWGNDPTVLTHFEGNPAPIHTVVNPDLKETVVNTDPNLPPMHLGFGMRLSGPVDNTLSSCKSCHSAAQYPAISPILAFLATTDGRPVRCSDPEWMRWFRNTGPTQTFDAGTAPMDNSLQLSGSVQNFLAAKNLSDGGLYAGQYWKGRPVLSIYSQRGAEPPAGAACNKS